jgi:hypothetical protein
VIAIYGRREESDFFNYEHQQAPAIRSLQPGGQDGFEKKIAQNVAQPIYVLSKLMHCLNRGQK